MKNQKLNRIELAIYYIFIFFILNEWLSPILVLTKTGYYKLILLFIAISLFLKWLNIHVAISWFIRIAYIGWFIIYVYSDETPISMEGLSYLLNVFQHNFPYIITLDFHSITDPFRSILLFILIWMLIYLIHHWIVVKLNIFYFLLMTVVFISVLDTYTKYDGSTTMVKIIVIGLGMSAFLYLKNLMLEKEINFEYKKYLKMTSPIILMIVCISIISIMLPKAAPQWPDPVPYIKSATSSGGLFGKDKVAKIGYDEDDSQLGGSFIGDDTVVFKVKDDKKQYWRVETKDFYTSKGWESTSSFGNTIYEIEEPITPFLPVGPDENSKFATVINEGENDFLIYPYGIKKISADTITDTNIVIDENIEKFSFTDNKNEYIVQYSTPIFQYSVLMDSQENADEYSFLNDVYLQLPDTMPQRVKDLAYDIVKDKNSTYEKARAIEMYFRSNGFRYDTKNVAVPAENQDYVDQFLFETKVGYCDNFSTSMVVLLRSVGIPARWVKGFVTGDIVEVEDGKNVYEITNNEAHSWVEAYIPEVGWVNFEPTIGFTNNRSIDFDIESNNTDEDLLEVEEETKPKEKKEDTKTTKDKSKGLIQELKSFFSKNIVVIIIILVSILALAAILFILRGKWTWKLSLRKLKKKRMTKDNFEQHYLLLLKVLESKGLKRKDGQTLSSFAQLVDEKYNTNAMTEITSVYEKFIYSKANNDIDFGKMKEIWEFLLKSSVS